MEDKGGFIYPQNQFINFMRIVEVRFFNFLSEPLVSLVTMKIFVKFLVYLLEAEHIEFLIILNDYQAEVKLGNGHLQLFSVFPFT